MICPYCGATTKDEHPKFCPSCGKTLEHETALAKPPPGVGAAAGGTTRTPDGVLAPGQEETFFEGHPAAIGSIGALLVVILTAGLAAIYFWIRARGTKYRLTSQRVIVETGVFGKRVDQLDLYRVVDFVVERSFGQRVMGTGTITVDAMDKTSPITRIEGIRANVMGLYERMRASAEVEKQRHLVRPMDLERP